MFEYVPELNPWPGTSRGAILMFTTVGPEALLVVHGSPLLSDPGSSRDSLHIHFNNSIKIQSNYCMVYYYRGMSKIHNNQLQEAIAACENGGRNGIEIARHRAKQSFKAGILRSLKRSERIIPLVPLGVSSITRMNRVKQCQI